MNVSCADTCAVQCGTDNIALSVNSGSCETNFISSIIVDCASLDNSVDCISICQSIFQTLENHDSSTASSNSSSSVIGKGTTVPIW